LQAKNSFVNQQDTKNREMNSWDFFRFNKKMRAGRPCAENSLGHSQIVEKGPGRYALALVMFVLPTHKPRV